MIGPCPSEEAFDHARLGVSRQRPDSLEIKRRALVRQARQEAEEARIQAMIDTYEDQDRLALDEALNQKGEWN